MAACCSRCSHQCITRVLGALSVSRPTGRSSSTRCPSCCPVTVPLWIVFPTSRHLAMFAGALMFGLATLGAMDSASCLRASLRSALADRSRELTKSSLGEVGWRAHRAHSKGRGASRWLAVLGVHANAPSGCSMHRWWHVRWGVGPPRNTLDAARSRSHCWLASRRNHRLVGCWRARRWPREGLGRARMAVSPTSCLASALFVRWSTGRAGGRGAACILSSRRLGLPDGLGSGAGQCWWASAEVESARSAVAARSRSAAPRSDG